MSVLGACFSRRLQRIQSWSKLPIAAWLLLAIYADSYMFIFTTALLKDVGINDSLAVCDGAILMCEYAESKTTGQLLIPAHRPDMLHEYESPHLRISVRESSEHRLPANICDRG